VKHTRLGTLVLSTILGGQLPPPHSKSPVPVSPPPPQLPRPLITLSATTADRRCPSNAATLFAAPCRATSAAVATVLLSSPLSPPHCPPSPDKMVRTDKELLEEWDRQHDNKDAVKRRFHIDHPPQHIIDVFMVGGQILKGH
jgi:hypothetical protein